jgi:predicted permease
MNPGQAAEAAFRWLLRLYPARFRRIHGLALFELFRDELREASATGSRWRALIALAHAAADTAANVPAAWRDALRCERWEKSASDRSGRRAALLSGLAEDVKLALRRFGRAPTLTALAAAMLAVGIGATTTVFSLANAILLRPLSASEPDRVVRIVAYGDTGAAGTASRRFSYRDFVDYRDRATTVEHLAGVNLATLIMAGDNRSDQILGEIASGEYLPLLGGRASHGRLLTLADDQPEAAPVVVISDALWRRRFGGAAVLGRQILLNRTHYTIVGVAEPSLVGSFVAAPVDAWIPLESSGEALGPAWRSDRRRRTLALIARLGRGVKPLQAQAELQTIGTAVARELSPELHPRIDVLPGTLVSGEERQLATQSLSLLLGVVVLALVVACANVANLLLARVFGRRRELAVRLAVGASRARLARMIAVESLMLAALGGTGALAIASAASELFAGIAVLPTLTLRLDVRSDLRVIAFTAVASILSGAALGAVGALHALRPNVAPALQEESLSTIGGRSGVRFRSALAVVQVVVSLLLLVCAGLFTRSVRGAAAIDLGFDPSNVVVLDVDASGGRTNTESVRFFDTVLERLRQSPFISGAAVASRAPLDSSTPVVHVSATGPVSEGDGNGSVLASFLVVSPEFFEVVRMPLAAGRPFASTDDSTRTRVAIVNETMAARLWPPGDPIGRRLWLEPAASDVPCLVIGVARDAKYRTLGEHAQPHAYLPFAQQPRRGMALLMRSSAPPSRTIETAQDAVRAADPNVQGFFARTLREHVDVSVLPLRLASTLTLTVAACALGFAAIGLFSLVSYFVAERTAEIGLRMALGADSTAVVRLVTGTGMRLAATGIVIGIPIALASARLVGSLLYGVSPADPAVFMVVSGVVLIITFVACYIPARRATRLDPVEALRRG